MGTPAKRPLKKAVRSGQQPDNQRPDEDLEEEIVETDATLEDDNEDGDGPDNDEDEPAAAAPVAQDEPLEPIKGAPRDGKTFRTGEKVVFKGEKKGGEVVSMENIYRASKHPTSSRWRFHLILSKGGSVPVGKTRAIEGSDSYEAEQKNLI